MTIPDEPNEKMVARSESSEAPPVRASNGSPHWSLGAVIPTDPRGRHELLRLAGGLARGLHSPTGDAITAGVTAVGVEPATVERVVSSLKDYGVIALVNGVLYALGMRAFLQDIGVRPREAELRIAERIERAGDTPFFVVAVARAHCLGIFGAPRQVNSSNSSIITTIR